MYPAALEMLYTGQQCSSCGLRFTDERSKEYGQHLDWHFKRNQVSKENRTLSRAWLVPKEVIYSVMVLLLVSLFLLWVMTDAT